MANVKRIDVFSDETPPGSQYDGQGRRHNHFRDKGHLIVAQQVVTNVPFTGRRERDIFVRMAALKPETVLAYGELVTGTLLTPAPLEEGMLTLRTEADGEVSIPVSPFSVLTDHPELAVAVAGVFVFYEYSPQHNPIY